MEPLIYKKKFNELSVEELYYILRLRSQVFVLEQQCLYEDIDEKDLVSQHYFIKNNQQIVSYLRILPQGLRYLEYTLSRVVSDMNYRKHGYAKRLILEAINDLKGNPIRISGQAYLKDYYERFGFQIVHGPYLEDNIPHFEMYLPNI